MAEVTFGGFPEEGIRFLRSLERNNRREWFQPRKEIFDSQVKAPMTALVGELNRGLTKFAPDYITLPAHAIYRIYRDTRFSNDKTPYKTHIAASFRRRGLDKHSGGGFYVSVSHKEVEVAGGVYMPGPEQLLAIRTHIAAHGKAFRKLIDTPRVVKLMEEMKGDALARIPKGFSAEDPVEDLIRKKQWLYYVLLDPAVATGPQIVKEVLERFRAMSPFLEFLNTRLKKLGVRPEEVFGI